MRLKVGMNGFSVRALCLLVGAGMLLSMLAMSAAFGIAAGDARLFWAGGALTLCGLAWLWALTRLFGRRLSRFAGDLCRILDDMMDGGEAPRDAADSETLFARIYGRLIRLYGVLQRSRLRVDAERRELQALISDISHQVKTPVSNLRMIVDTLLVRPVAERERTDFLQGLRSQTDKLDFLLQALVKTSRLETGAIRLEKREGNLYQTLAQAMSGIVYGAEKKGIAVGVDCPEELRLFHDAKWTAEALFNLLDNAVKYTPAGGRIDVRAELWEMYVKVDVRDTGRGIAESNQAAVFRRFYREAAAHDAPGVGIGLFLAREIIARQGGYIRVSSAPGKGSTFSVFLPRR